MSTIILIAGLGMFNTLAIIVMERAREIAILRSIGYTRTDVLWIFLYQGVIVYALGLVIGCLAGAGLTALVESLPIRIRGIFATDHFIMEWSLSHYGWAALVTGIVVLLASILPARRAAKIEPGTVIRGDFRMTPEAIGKTVLEVRNLHRWLGSGANRNHVLRGLNFSLRSGRTYAVVGPSGCGKSTLLYLLGLLDRPDEGEILLGGHRVDSAADRERTRLRAAELGFVFQFHFLLSEFSARENIMLPMLKMGVSVEEAGERASALLREVDLGNRENNRGNELSGGEQQRVAIARALANKPRVILADEPTGNLDQRNSAALFGLLQRVAHDRGHTVLIVTHNLDLAAQCDEILEMRDGQFVKELA